MVVAAAFLESHSHDAPTAGTRAVSKKSYRWHILPSVKCVSEHRAADMLQA